MQKYAIIGFGCAGYSAAKALRNSGFTGEIHVCDADLKAPANPMLTTYFTSGRLPEEQMYPFGRQAEIIYALALTMHSGQAVRRVLPAEKVVELEDGSSMVFDKLLLSTGAQAFVPPLDGLPAPQVFTMRTPEEARQLRTFLEKTSVKNAVVVGASMVGVKVAEFLLNQGVDTTLADAAPHLFPLAAFEESAAEMQERMAAQGLHFKWGSAISGVEDGSVRFQDGDSLRADLICLCIGTRPNIGLIERGGSPGRSLNIQRGIVVNERMETNLPGVYAAGDCCEGRNLQTGDTMIIGLWANAAAQGAVAGMNMAGVDAVCDGNVPHNITHFMGIDFIALGDPHAPGERFTFTIPDTGSHIRVAVQQGALSCINIMDAYQISGTLKSLLLGKLRQPGKKLTHVQRGLLKANGFSEEFLNLLEGNS